MDKTNHKPSTLATPALNMSDAVGVAPGWQKIGMPAVARWGRVYVLPDGTTVRCSYGGNLDVVVYGGRPDHRSIASDPSAIRRRP